MPNIIDVIHHYVKAYDLTQVFVVIDKPLDLKYERRNGLLLAEDDGFFDAYAHETPTQYSKAFAGRVFDIPMLDGTVTKATGQWWSVVHPRKSELTQVGVNTIAALEQCYVFSMGYVLTSKLQSWLASNSPSTDYNKYDTRNVVRKDSLGAAH